MLRVFTTVILLGGFGLEILILMKIFEPQGAWRGSSFADIAYYGPWSALPYLAVLAWFILTLRNQHISRTIFRCALGVAILGVVIAFIALRQGGHASAGLLPIGFICQWTALGVGFVAAWRNRSPRKV